MCGICGCSGAGGANVVVPGGEAMLHHPHHHGWARDHEHANHAPDAHGHGHDHGDAHGHEHLGCHGHAHDSDHGHGHGYSSGPAHIEVLESRLLDKNDRLAEQNRAWFAGREILALNLMSSPGAGKTTLLVRTLAELGLPAAVVEGDQESTLDADRIRAAGAPVVQINTGTGCHLEAQMVRSGVDRLKPAFGSVLFIENVGNLVCPSLFDLGEHARVVLLSAAEGADKPTKYPHMFRRADLVLLTKMDLAPHVDFDEAAAVAAIRAVQPGAPILRVSARTGEGIEAWSDWIKARFRSVHAT